MKLALVLGLAFAAVACGKSDPGATVTSTAASTTKTAAATPAAVSAAPTTPPAPAFVQKGVKSGKVVVGYMQDSADEGQCAVVTDAPAKKDEFTKNGDKLAAMMKAKVVASCPTDHVVGTCNVGMGMLSNYSGPKWTAETAKKDCLAHPHQTWVD